jgi:hypothetical protein
MTINSIKTLKLTMGADSVECQLTTAQLVDEPEGAETLTTFCSSVDVAGTPKYTLNISGFQDYGEAESVFTMLHEAYTDATGADIDCVLTVGKETRSFPARPQNDPPFGGDAGAALTADVALAVTGDIVDGVVPPVAAFDASASDSDETDDELATASNY